MKSFRWLSREAAYWGAIGLAAIVAILLFKLLATKVAWAPLQTLAAAV
jgi:hypothetical protein